MPIPLSITVKELGVLFDRLKTNHYEKLNFDIHLEIPNEVTKICFEFQTDRPN